MKPKTEIEIKLIETIHYSKHSERFEAYCPECGSTAEFTTPHTAALITGSSEREIYRLIEANAIHFVETDRVLVCQRSLSNYQNKPGD